MALDPEEAKKEAAKKAEYMKKYSAVKKERCAYYKTILDSLRKEENSEYDRLYCLYSGKDAKHIILSKQDLAIISKKMDIKEGVDVISHLKGAVHDELIPAKDKAYHTILEPESYIVGFTKLKYLNKVRRLLKKGRLEMRRLN